MGIITTVKAVKTVAKTVKKAKFVAAAGGAVVHEVKKGVQGAKTANRLDALESFAYELIFEKTKGPYIDGARLFDATKKINLAVSAGEDKGARYLTVNDSNRSTTLFTIKESRARYRWNGDTRPTDFLVTADGVRNGKLELKFGGTFWKYSLPSKGLNATESSTGYKVVNSKKEVVAETVGKLRSESSALVYIRDEKEFNLSLAMLFAPIFFQGITAPENLSEEYEKYHNKMSSRFGLF